MAEAAEESGKENFLSGWSDGRNVSEADRESPATREATEKENTAAAGSGRAGCREISEKYRESPLNIRNIKLASPERCLRLLASCSAWRGVFFRRKCPHAEVPAAAESTGGRVQRQAGGASRPFSKHVASSPQTNSSAGLSAEVVSCRAV